MLNVNLNDRLFVLKISLKKYLTEQNQWRNYPVCRNSIRELKYLNDAEPRLTRF